MSAPCKDCPDRAMGCHGRCEKFLEFRKVRDKISANRQIEGDAIRQAKARYARIEKQRHARKKKWSEKDD